MHKNFEALLERVKISMILYPDVDILLNLFGLDECEQFVHKFVFDTIVDK